MAIIQLSLHVLVEPFMAAFLLFSCPTEFSPWILGFAPK